MKLSAFIEMALPEIEDQMKSTIALSKQGQDDTLFQILCYHLGWTDQKLPPNSQGKRIRPLILLLATETSSGDWKNAIPAAASIELIHNFSLIHDDIEDQSEVRRGRLTLWNQYSLPLAINAGDAMFALSFISLGGLQRNISCEISFQAYNLFSQACLLLTKGQHLDMSFEKMDQVPVQTYIEMIEGKTAALLALSSKMGALIAGADAIKQELYFELGKNMGLAFQIFDDILGIWGDPDITGKSAATDLITRKKSLPILFGLSQNGAFREMWEENITPDKISLLSDQLKHEGGLEFALDYAKEYSSAAINAFYQADPSGPSVEAFEELIHALTDRKS